MSALKLSKAARERIAYEGNHYGERPEDYVPVMAAEALERPSDSYWRDEDMWNTHTVMFAYSPLADDLLGESNYHTILAALTAEFPGDSRVEASGFGHWTYAHFDAIKIRVLDKRGRITPEFAMAAVYARALQDYPLFDEEDYSERESAEYDRQFTEELNWLSRSVELTDAQRQAIWEWVNDRYYGTSDPGWVNPDWITEAATELNISLESE